MITVYGEGRGFRVIWLLEEMGLAYKLRPVDLLAGVENDPEFLSINPGGFIPALVDGDVKMVESIAIMEYLLARYGDKSKSPLAPAANDPNFGLYQQFLHLGEAGLGANIQVVVVSGFVAPQSERDNWGARWALDQFNNRMKLVKRQLARTPYLAGDAFTAADISVTYTLSLATRRGGIVLDETERAYMARTTSRDAYKRALDACPATKGFYGSVPPC
ncbi:MAG TPA: glutathione S-transferase family protein [Rhizomicrobium sp.]|jgi:glutathione S-transferase|nr:glutathione S-transferase family protein [Rhizomicrobium sp.]